MASPNKRYQIFISSTYTDLKEERAAVVQAIMELGHMSYGMEAFPAANETQWEWIKRAIRESDYYIVIVGGKYGSVNNRTGLSYTEMEYRYAEEIGIPIAAFLVDDSVDLPKSKIELDSVKAQKLNDFRVYIESKKMRKSYTSKENLRSNVLASLPPLIRQCPRTGWIKADAIEEYTPNSEVVRLKKENRELKKEKKVLAQGEDRLQITYTLTFLDYANVLLDPKELHKGSFDLTWNEVYLSIASPLYCEERRLSKKEIKQIVEAFIGVKVDSTIEELKPKSKGWVSVEVSIDQIQTILLQFEALKYMTSFNGEWMLTKTGRNHYISHHAIMK